MENTHLSLLWPQNMEVYASKTNKLNTAAADSLDLDELCRNMSKNEKQSKIMKEILTDICCDEEVIEYRQGIVDDFLRSKELTVAFENILKRLEEMKGLTVQATSYEEAKLFKLFSKFKELEGYVDCVVEIKNSLQGLDLRSKGLCALKKKAEDICADEEFKALSVTVKNLNLELNQIQSITLGINLDSSLNPCEAMLVSVNNTRFTDYSWFKDFFQITKQIKVDKYDFASKIHRLSDDRRDVIMYSMYQDIEKMLKPVIKDLSINLKQYMHIGGYYLLNLIPEITFYLGVTRLLKSLKESGMPLCKPVVERTEDRKCVIEDLYNVNLALHMLQKYENPVENIVLNKISFDENGRILIITGPNRGGKTVYTEAVGLAYVLFHAGAFVPGTRAAISPVDAIFTHFPVDENQTVELGRLGEEAKRLNEIFGAATKYSLILFNESLASTSFTEGLFIAQDVVKALRYLGARAIFNTHMHELATYADMINSDTPGDSKVVSLVTGLVDGKRSYIIQPGAPLGKSYAMDIALKFGVSYEQIVKTIEKSNQGI